MPKNILAWRHTGSLPESEKEYDRSAALETVKLILKLGYEIRKG